MPSAAVAKVLGIADDTSLEGAGLSLRGALRQIGYGRIRNELSLEKMREALDADPALIQAWMSYCQDKRTSGGWYLDPNGLEIGRLDDPGSSVKLESISEITAAYVLSELDYWWEVGKVSSE